MFTESHINALKSGKIAVLPTDTLYGLVGSAFDKTTIGSIESLKGDTSKRTGYIVLLEKAADVEKFGALLTVAEKNVFESLWPGPFSIVVKVNSNAYDYLTHTDEIAFRVPNNSELRDLLSKTGPLVAPSANPTGMPPARNIDEAKAYFGGKVDMYIDGGNKSEVRASTLLRIHNNSDIEVLRMGDIDPKTLL